MSYGTMSEYLYQLLVRTRAFDTEIKAESPNWDAVLEHHLELCHIEEVLNLKERR